MKSTPRSTARRSTDFAVSGSSGGPQIPSPVSRIAPKPRRRTSRSPPRDKAPAAAASVLSIAMSSRLPVAGNRKTGARAGWVPRCRAGYQPRPRRTGAGAGFSRVRPPDSLVRERELHVGTRDRHERPRLGRAAVERLEVGVDDRYEVEVAAVQVIREATPVALARKRDLADDAVAVGLEHDPLGSRLHTLTLSAGFPWA